MIRNSNEIHLTNLRACCYLFYEIKFPVESFKVVPAFQKHKKTSKTLILVQLHPPTLFRQVTQYLDVVMPVVSFRKKRAMFGMKTPNHTRSKHLIKYMSYK